MYKFFPIIEPYKIEFLQVTKFHKLYIEQSGNPTGKPIIGFHGGPGSSQSKSDHRRFYNSQKYRIILFDQRGCGKIARAKNTKEELSFFAKTVGSNFFLTDRQLFPVYNLGFAEFQTLSSLQSPQTQSFEKSQSEPMAGIGPTT